PVVFLVTNTSVERERKERQTAQPSLNAGPGAQKGDAIIGQALLGGQPPQAYWMASNRCDAGKRRENPPASNPTETASHGREQRPGQGDVQHEGPDLGGREGVFHGVDA